MSFSWKKMLKKAAKTGATAAATVGGITGVSVEGAGALDMAGSGTIAGLVAALLTCAANYIKVKGFKL